MKHAVMTVLRPVYCTGNPAFRMQQWMREAFEKRMACSSLEEDPFCTAISAAVVEKDAAGLGASKPSTSAVLQHLVDLGPIVHMEAAAAEASSSSDSSVDSKDEDERTEADVAMQASPWPESPSNPTSEQVGRHAICCQSAHRLIIQLAVVEVALCSAGERAGARARHRAAGPRILYLGCANTLEVPLPMPTHLSTVLIPIVFGYLCRK